MKRTVEEFVQLSDISSKLKGEELAKLGRQILEGVQRDLESRVEWEERMGEAIKLALQVSETKNTPWPNASNVKFPLLTISALQFLARISLMTKGRQLARMGIIGVDPTGQKYQVAERISSHINFQLRHTIPHWHDSDERTKLSAAILGSGFKKTYFDAPSRTIKSTQVPAQDLIVDYLATSLEDARRVTHRYLMTKSQLQQEVLLGNMNEFGVEHIGSVYSGAEGNPIERAYNEAIGITAVAESGETESYEVYEQHTWLDLDEDGIEEPYIITAGARSGTVLRIVARYWDKGDVFRTFDEDITELEEKLLEVKDPLQMLEIAKRIEAIYTDPKNKILGFKARNYFTQYTFIPSVDGGIYGIGLGLLLGANNDAVDSLINQLIDSGTMSNLAGGFISRGVKMLGGTQNFSPFEWKPVDTGGAVLKDALVPLPVREPSGVLFQLLELLIQYAERISGATDIMSGITPGQNTPAETSRNTVEQGMVLFSGIYARMYRAFGLELKKLYKVNQLFLKLTPEYKELTQGKYALISVDDYTKGGVLEPAASPEITSSGMRKEKATMLLQLYQAKIPGLDGYQIVKRYLEAWEIEDIDIIFPSPTSPRAVPPVPNPEMELEKAQLQLQAQIHKDTLGVSIATLKKEMALNEAKILELRAKAAKEAAEAKDTGGNIALELLKTQIEAAQSKEDSLNASIKVLSDAAAQQNSTEGQQSQQGQSTEPSRNVSNSPQ